MLSIRDFQILYPLGEGNNNEFRQLFLAQSPKKPNQQFILKKTFFQEEKEATRYCEELSKWQKCENEGTQRVENFSLEKPEQNQVCVISVSKFWPQTLSQVVVNRFDDTKNCTASGKGVGLGYDEKIINYFPEEFVFKAMWQLTQTVAFMHSQNMVHTPGHIRADTIFVNDGCTQFVFELAPSTNVLPKWRFFDHLMPYIAPEFRNIVRRSEELNEPFVTVTNTQKGDMWALGVVFFQLMGLVDNSTAALIVNRSDAISTHLKREFARLTDVYHRKLRKYVNMLLSIDPKQRYTAAALLTKLKTFEKQFLKPKQQAVSKIAQLKLKYEQKIEETSSNTRKISVFGKGNSAVVPAKNEKVDWKSEKATRIQLQEMIGQLLAEKEILVHEKGEAKVEIEKLKNEIQRLKSIADEKANAT